MLSDCCQALTANGKLILSFRDYTVELKDGNRFIPVKSDENRILTCFLEYYPAHVTVTDLLYEKEEPGWTQKVSSYDKMRLAPLFIRNYLARNGMEIIFDEILNRLTTIIAVKGEVPK